MGCLILISSCDNRSSSRTEPGKNQDKKNPALKSLDTGENAFSFEPTEVIDLTLAKFDSESGNSWVMTLHKEDSLWKISSAPSDQSLLDRIADETFIHHLLDTLQSVHLHPNPKSGPMESFGLKPPRYALKWSTLSKEFKIQVGISSPGLGYFVTLDGTSISVGTGAAFGLLERVLSFRDLRKQTWTILKPDDIDEIELLKNKAPHFYAQRDGDTWTDRKHRPVRINVSTVLSQLTSTRPENFVDDPIRAQELRKYILSKESLEVRLTNRFGKTHSLKLSQREKSVYGINTTRPDGVFILPKALLDETRALTGTKN